MSRETLALWLLGIVTLLCMVYTFVVPFAHPDNASLAGASLDVASFIFKAGFGFFVGLISGTTAAKNRPRQ